MRRVGLLGGTFDPVHVGHVAIAELALEALALDEVLFIPAADPPHKKKPIAGYEHRVTMLEHAIGWQDKEPGKGKNKFCVSLIESELSLPSYTVDTLHELKNRLGDNQKLFFIIGADSLLEIHLWYRYRELLTLTSFIVVARPTIANAQVTKAIEDLPGSFIPQSDTNTCWQRADGAEIVYLPESKQNISSSIIRRQLAAGELPGTVNSRVLQYINTHGLYISNTLCAAQQQSNSQ